MVNCKHLDCKSNVSKIVGFCKNCEKYFCSQHRYIEAHNCPKLLEVKLNSKQELIKKLHESAYSKDKLMKI